LSEKKSLSPSRVLRFGVFQVNLAAREIRKHGVRVRLSGQPFCILSILLEKPGEVVTREEMREKLWTDTFVDFEHSLNSAIKKLRAALGDSPENSRYIETIPRVGYRFVAPVEEDMGNAQSVPQSEPVPVGAGSAAEAVEPRHRRWTALLGISAVLIVVTAGYLMLSRAHDGPKAPGGRITVAVLPFENLTGDAGQEYLSDGLTEEMIAQIGRLDPEHLGVIARTSVMHYKRGQVQLDQIGRELGVQYVLEGSLRRDADKVRITAQFVQTKDQTPVWSREYDRELSSLLALQGEIAQEIADEIRLSLGPSRPFPAPDRKPAVAPSSYAAYDLYLKGRYFWNKRTREGLQQAAEYFQQSIDKDSNYARAYAGLADTFALMGSWSYAPQIEFMPKARAAALRALQIDDGLAEAHTSLALIAENYDYDWQTAEREFRRAIQLDPQYATAHQWYAECLSFQGRYDDAMAESERARQLDPLSLIIATDHGAILYFARQYDRAIYQFNAVLAMEPSFSRARFLLSYAYVEKGMFSEALAQEGAGKWHQSDGTPAWDALAYLHARSGQKAQARSEMAKWEQLNRKHSLPSSNVILMAYVAMDEKGKALALLDQSYQNHSISLTTLKVEPAFDPLRGDPRFQDLLRRVGLAK
jgi:TolB-like protein/DNA-binding winged helix-turn-helix (wHTH) protein/Flp pilus assembly protein TadD